MIRSVATTTNNTPHSKSGLVLKSNLLLKSSALLIGALLLNQAQAATQHVVEAGETINDIATRYSVSKTALIDANGLQAIEVIAGQRLQVPDKDKSHNLHKVSATETLSTLSKKYNIDLTELARVNNVTPQSGLLVDSILVIPAIKTAAISEQEKLAPVASLSAIVGSDKTVANGPTVPASTTIAPTNVAPVATKVTPKTVAPSMSVAADTSISKNSRTHIVKYGESLSSIADLYKVTVSSLAQVNNMKVTDTLYFGRAVTLPSPENMSNIKTSNKAATSQTSKNAAPIKYKVKSGDTLIAIANKFKTDFMTISTLSGIEYYAPLKVDQILTIPSNSNVVITYE